MLSEAVTQAVQQASEGISIEISTILKFGTGMAFVMLIIYLLAELTPKIAKRTDKFLEKHRPAKNKDDRTHEVKSIYDMPDKK